MNRRITGFIDCIDDNIVYELKCVQELKNEHFLQLAFYCYLHETEILLRQKILQQRGRKASRPLRIGDRVIIIDNGQSLITGTITEMLSRNGRINVRTPHRTIMTYRSQVLSVIPQNGDIAEQPLEDPHACPKFEYRLFNVLTGEMFRIKTTIGELKKMVEHIIFNKFYNSRTDQDDVFVNKMLSLVAKYDVSNKIESNCLL